MSVIKTASSETRKESAETEGDPAVLTGMTSQEELHTIVAHMPVSMSKATRSAIIAIWPRLSVSMGSAVSVLSPTAELNELRSCGQRFALVRRVQ